MFDYCVLGSHASYAMLRQIAIMPNLSWSAIVPRVWLLCLRPSRLYASAILIRSRASCLTIVSSAIVPHTGFFGHCDSCLFLIDILAPSLAKRSSGISLQSEPNWPVGRSSIMIMWYSWYPGENDPDAWLKMIQKMIQRMMIPWLTESRMNIWCELLSRVTESQMMNIWWLLKLTESRMMHTWWLPRINSVTDDSMVPRLLFCRGENAWALGLSSFCVQYYQHRE